MKIPKIIHFIWAGGQRKLPPMEVDVVTDWANQNPGFQIYLWVDKSTGTDDMVQHYTTQFRERGIHVSEGTGVIASDLPIDKPTPVVLLDVSSVHHTTPGGSSSSFRDDFVAYEIDKPRPNYGASSDLLRYQILHEFGGAYFDFDVLPGALSLKASGLFTEVDQHVLYVDHYPQQPHATAEQLRHFRAEMIGNDTFICTPKNPLMAGVARQSRDHYRRGIVPINLCLQLAHSGQNIQDMTIYATGPAIVRRVLLAGVEEQGDALINRDVLIKRVRDGREMALTQPKKNTAHWLNAKMNEYKNLIDADRAFEQMIRFEMAHFKVLRLDDFVTDFKESCKKITAMTPGQSLRFIGSILKRDGMAALMRDVSYVQLTCQYPETIQFCHDKNFTTLFNLNFEGIQGVLMFQGYLNDILGAEAKAMQDVGALSVAKAEGIPPIVALLRKSDKQHRKTFCMHVQKSFEVIDNLLQNTQLFKSQADIPKILDLFKETLDKYQEYSVHLNSTMDEPYKISLEKLTVLREKCENLSKLLPKQHENLHKQPNK